MNKAWLNTAITPTGTSKLVVVDQASIHYQQWKTGVDKPGVVLVHGHAANSHWWDFIAPSLRDDYNVVAIDLSGNGDSDHRPEYSASGYAAEIMAVSADAGLRDPVLVGHSFGGSMARITAHLNQSEIAGLIIVDSMISKNRSQRATPAMPRNRSRYYDSLVTGARRFRLRPPQPVTHPDIVDYIARHSLRQTSEGFAFKLDQAVFAKMTHREDFPDAYTMLDQMSVPIGFIYGCQSRFFPPEVLAAMRPLFEESLFTGIEAAYHHVFLDQPEAFVAALTTQLKRMAAHHHQS